MHEQDFLKLIDETLKEMHDLTASKGQEYRSHHPSQFANFERGARDLGLTREQVLLVYLSKHLDSIRTWVKDNARGVGREYAEPIEGRINDAILYLLLFKGMVQDGRTPPAADYTVAIMGDQTHTVPRETNIVAHWLTEGK